MPVERFDQEYQKIRDTLKRGKFHKPLKSTMTSLKGVLAEEGPKQSLGKKLDSLRTSLKNKNEGEQILKACGIDPGSNKTPSTAAVEQVAAMKYLRHLHMLKESGAQKVWLYTSPKQFDKYTWDQIKAAGSSTTSLKTQLNKKDEVFSALIQQRLAEATREGAVWVSKTLLVLADAKKKKDKAKEMVDRWFGQSSTKYMKGVQTLTDGFKKIKSTLSHNNVVITDHPPDRSTANYTEAYVYGSLRPRAIYIEKALMNNYDISVLHDMKKNWTRVIVHECTHLDAATDDDGGYAWKGIKPGTKVTAENAIKNADNWAFFAADCAGALTDGERTRAMNGTGGDLTELQHNWN